MIKMSQYCRFYWVFEAITCVSHCDEAVAGHVQEVQCEKFSVLNHVRHCSSREPLNFMLLVSPDRKAYVFDHVRIVES